MAHESFEDKAIAARPAPEAMARQLNEALSARQPESDKNVSGERFWYD
jgi:hypothetical protein